MRIRDWSSDVCSSDLPGFSTAAKVTSISGRGVGMDIVKSNIEKIGGVVELRHEEGRGLTLILRVPMTLTIISGLMVRAAGQYFAIPRELGSASWRERVFRNVTIPVFPVLLKKKQP